MLLSPELHAADHTKKISPLDYTIQYPEELNAPFSLDAPPCKTFTVVEKQKQIADGERILAEIVAAEKAGKDEYVIPAGDYRFPQKANPKFRTAIGPSIWRTSSARMIVHLPSSAIG